MFFTSTWRRRAVARRHQNVLINGRASTIGVPPVAVMRQLREAAIARPRRCKNWAKMLDSICLEVDFNDRNPRAVSSVGTPASPPTNPKLQAVMCSSDPRQELSER